MVTIQTGDMTEAAKSSDRPIDQINPFDPLSTSHRSTQHTQKRIDQIDPLADPNKNGI